MTLNDPDGQYRSAIIGDLRLVGAEPEPETAEPASAVGGLAEAPVDVLIELNVGFPGGLERVTHEFLDLWTENAAAATVDAGPTATPPPVPVRVNDRLYQCAVTPTLLRGLIAADRRLRTERPPVIFKVPTRPGRRGRHRRAAAGRIGPPSAVAVDL